jgi:RNA-directed DNA polymerase
LSTLQKLQQASTLKQFADVLGYEPKSLSFILYKIADDKKYSTFQIPKKDGSQRLIEAPINRLKGLQRRLADVLYACSEELVRKRTHKQSVSHGFKKNHSIITNALPHRKRRYVLNFDLKDFFPSINFGRVRGFFIRSRDFHLSPTVATLIAQIACHQNRLPQGSPSSPIISDLITHLLDLRLVGLAKKYKCYYSRYADDLTFSTNQKDFPSRLAHADYVSPEKWHLGKLLTDQITKAGFSINPTKTRMQYRQSRQMVTGLTVNQTANIRADYYRQARAMCHRLFKDGVFQFDDNSKGSAEQLRGILDHIYAVKRFTKERRYTEQDRILERRIHVKDLRGVEKLYYKLLFFQNFANPKLPLVICEGKTDSIYLKCALKQRKKFHAKLGTVSGAPFTSKLRYFNYNGASREVLRLGGGSSELASFIANYRAGMDAYKLPPLQHPIIILIDNDDGSKVVFGAAKSAFKTDISINKNDDFYHLGANLYLIKTPTMGANVESKIEDLFDKSLLSTKLNGKTFSSKNNFDSKTEYGKFIFAEHVVRPQAKKINFSGFDILLSRIEAVIDHYTPPKVSLPLN